MITRKSRSRIGRNSVAKECRKLNRQNHGGRKLAVESLEDRRMLALVGVAPLDMPTIGYDSGGTVSYDSASDMFSVQATPLNIDTTSSSGLFFTGNLDINIEVDGTGALVGGVPGDDLVLTGDVDIDGDFIVDESGVLLTGEITAFGHQDSGGLSDTYDYRFTVTGGALASLYAGKDLGITLTSENSTFGGDFSVDFGGNAKGLIGAIDPEDDCGTASLGNYFFVDSNDNGVQDAGDLGVNGVTVNLLDSGGSTLATTVTANDDSGNAGYYLFYQLDAGDYIVEFDVPDEVVFTIKDVAGNSNDALDSDVNANGRTDLISLADGEHRRDVDAGVKSEVCIDTKVYKVKDYFTWCQSANAGLIKGVTIEYNDTTDELFVQVTVKAYYGRIADGFTIVIDDAAGVNYTNAKDKFAIFYFDASGSTPVLNVFGYNTRFDATSYRDSNGYLGSYDPDKVATSLDNSSGWVKDLSVVNGYNTVVMSFRIDASAINNHDPLSPYVNWQGAEIGNYASFALDTYDKLYTKYGSDGFLTKWYYCYHGSMDACKIRTDKCIVEECVSIDDFFEEWGWEVSDFTGDSNGDPIADLNWEGSVDACFEDVPDDGGDSHDDNKDCDFGNFGSFLAKLFSYFS